MGEGLLPKEYKVAAAVVALRLVKFDAAGLIVQADAVGDDIIGVAAHAVTAEEFTAGKTQIRVNLLGKADVEAGAAYLPGARLTTDAAGRAVEAAPATGVNNAIGGQAIEEATALGDLTAMVINPHIMQGA